MISLIRLDLLLESMTGAISLLICHNATEAYRLTGQKRLSDLSTGFLVLAVAMFGRVAGTVYVFVLMASGGGENLARLLITGYGVMRIMAYVLFLVSTRPTLRHQDTPVTVVTMLAIPALVEPRLDIIATLVLIVVVLQAAHNYVSVRSSYALYVLSGFTCILLSHLLPVLAQNEVVGYLAGQVFQFLGLVLLLAMVVKAGRQG
ncbi:MAG: hypothetical protein HXY34_02040 [Candidatus Thorarchaeota archaeon]|nr:hypothetical protein [Candidatus Thorarchaeota archaeon]